MSKRRCIDKGPSFERKCCKILHVWWGEGVFMRTKNLQVLGRDMRSFHGDITCILQGDLPQLDPLFPFSVECKKQEGWNFSDLLKGNSSGTVEGFWMQCTADAKRWNKIPLLLFSKNHHPVYTAWPSCSSFPEPLRHTNIRIPYFEVVLSPECRFFISTWGSFIEAFQVNRKLVGIEDVRSVV